MKVSKKSKETTKKPPVFYDGSRIRGKLFIFSIVVTTLAFLYLQWEAYHLIFKNSMPSSLPGVNSSQQINSVEATLPNETIDSLKNTFKSEMVSGKRVAYYVTWSEESFNSLEKNISDIDILIPEFLTVSTNNTFTSINPDKEKSVTEFVRKKNSETKILPLISNYSADQSSFDNKLIINILGNKSIKDKFIDNLAGYVISNGYDGVNIDFEDIQLSQQWQYVSFMKDLNAKFKESNLIVTQSIPVDNADYLYSEYVKHNDYLIFMAYDYNWSTGKPGPIAPSQWFNTALSRIKSSLPIASHSKVIVALGGYGYGWTEGQTAAVNRDYYGSLLLAKENNTKVEFDPVSLNPYFKYTDEKMLEQTVWFLDATTFYNQTLEINKYPFAGIALWRLGSEDQDVWEILKDPLNPITNIQNLSIIEPELGVRQIGSGEISKIQSFSAPGQRTFTIDEKTGQITNVEIVEFPLSYIIQKWGGENNKQVALTFDDGPDPIYTKEILNILKENDVKATFFVIGANANVSSRLLSETYAAGHDIGNHTYLHSNLGRSSFNKIYPELNATELLVKDITGHRTNLFRAPFSTGYTTNIDKGKTSVREGLSGLGYYDVGVNVDPTDWLVLDSEKIAKSVIESVENNPTNSIVLLHDGGGDRSATVKALPTIISDLKDQGYTFVTISEMMALSNSGSGMTLLSENRFSLPYDKIEFSIIGFLAQFFGTLFITGIFIGISKNVIVIALASINKYRESKVKFDSSYLPKVSVIVPAWNEEKVIKKTINTLLKNLYPRLEIIVVDDGSTDNTYKVASEAYKDNPKVRVLTTGVNGGKSNAINFAVKKSRASIFVVQDADTVLAPDSILKLVRHMKNPDVAAVAGNVKVGNRINLITKFQAVEYIISQNLDRRAFHILNAISVVPGAIGAWRKKTVLEAGGFHSDTLAEDAELTLRILKLGYKIENEPEAIGYTEAPDNLKVFVKQRFRWMFGTLQAVWKVGFATLNTKNWALGVIVVPNVLIFQIVLSILSPFLDLYVFLTLLFMLWQKTINPEITLESINIILIYYLLFLVIDLVVAVIAFVMEPSESKKLLLFVLMQKLFHKYAMYYVSLKAIYTAISGPHVRWEIKAREDTVNELIAFQGEPN